MYTGGRPQRLLIIILSAGEKQPTKGISIRRLRDFNNSLLSALKSLKNLGSSATIATTTSHLTHYSNTRPYHCKLISYLSLPSKMVNTSLLLPAWKFVWQSANSTGNLWWYRPPISDQRRQVRSIYISDRQSQLVTRQLVSLKSWIFSVNIMSLCTLVPWG
jgi:hypothetical protein